MKNKTLIYILGGACAVFVLAFILSDPLRFGICRNSYTWIPQNDGVMVTECSDDASFIQAPAMFSVVLFFLSLILLFLREEIFKSWKTFAIWWIPLSALFILSAPSSGGGSIGIGGGIDREIVTWWFAGLFLIISLVLIIYKSIALRRKDGIMTK